MRVLKWVGLVVVLLAGGVAVAEYGFPTQTAAKLLAMEQERSGLHAASTAIEGLDMPYLEGGQGEPLMLIHGFGAEKNNFTRVARFLTPHYRVLIPDLIGFGDSAKPADADYGYAAQVERLRAFAKAMGVTKLNLGGSSMGGGIALHWAAKYPDEVQSLWLLAPAGTRAAMDSELRHHFQKTGEVLLVAKTPEDFERIGAFVMSKPGWVPHSVMRSFGERAAANHELHLKIFGQLSKEPVLEDLGVAFPMPALVVYGTEDRALNPKAGEVLKTMMPKGEVILMPGIGHLPMIEAVEQVAQDYLKFRGAGS